MFSLPIGEEVIQMQEFHLNGSRVTLGDPMIIAEGTGHVWFPSLLRFARGEVMCAYLLVADGWNHVDAYGLSVTKDGGQTWLPRYDVTDYHGGRLVDATEERRGSDLSRNRGPNQLPGAAV